ncbi:hypothetical protein JXB02_02290 [Candidatus Woesearchaeota archaeon]|nr:hypothetical protein [Candidatus Woesearchaeota archaeon]
MAAGDSREEDQAYSMVLRTAKAMRSFLDSAPSIEETLAGIGDATPTGADAAALAGIAETLRGIALPPLKSTRKALVAVGKRFPETANQNRPVIREGYQTLDRLVKDGKRTTKTAVRSLSRTVEQSAAAYQTALAEGAGTAISKAELALVEACASYLMLMPAADSLGIKREGAVAKKAAIHATYLKEKGALDDRLAGLLQQYQAFSFAEKGEILALEDEAKAVRQGYHAIGRRLAERTGSFWQRLLGRQPRYDTRGIARCDALREKLGPAYERFVRTKELQEKERERERRIGEARTEMVKEGESRFSLPYYLEDLAVPDRDDYCMLRDVLLGRHADKLWPNRFRAAGRIIEAMGPPRDDAEAAYLKAMQDGIVRALGEGPLGDILGARREDLLVAYSAVRGLELQLDRHPQAHHNM